MKKKLEKTAQIIFYVLLTTAPIGTRYIFAMGSLKGVDIEAGTFSLFATQVLAIVFLLVALFSHGYRKMAPITQTSFGGAAFLFAVASLSASLSGDTRSLVMLNWIFFGVGLLAATYKVCPRLRQSMFALAVGGTIQAMLSIWQFFAQSVTPSKWLGMAAHLPDVVGTFVVETAAGRWLRSYGTLPHPNMLGTYLVIATIASIYLAASLRGRWRAVAVTAVALNVVGLTLSMSRSAFVALIIGLSAFVSAAIFFHGGGPKAWRRIMGAVGVAILVLVASMALLRDPAAVRLMGRGRLEKISVEERFTQIDDAKMLMQDNQLLGVGPGLMPYELYLRDRSRSAHEYQYVHMTPLLMLVEVGAIGVLAYAVFLAGLVGLMYQALKRRVRLRRVALYSGLVALMVVGLFDHFMWSAWFGHLLLALIAGLVLSSAKEQIKTA